MSTPAPPPPGRRIAVLVVLLWAAFALRAVQLDRRPLWWDEGLSAHLSQYDPPGLIDEMRITHHADPPGYPLILSAWTRLAGGSPFALRFLSALLGTAAVALTWALGRRLAGGRTALFAAALVALAPAQVYYTREAKSYALASAGALLSIYAWGCRLGYARGAPSDRRRSARWWAAYVVGTALAVGSHYYLGLLVLWQGLWVAGGAARALIRRSAPPRRVLARAAPWVLAALAVGLILAPGVLPLLRSTISGVAGVSRGQEALPPWTYVGRVARELAVGPELGDAASWAAVAGLAALAVAGLLNARRGRAFLLAWIGVPLLAAYPLQAAFPFFRPRFLLYLQPACGLLVARGLAAAWRPRRLAAAAKMALALLVLVPWLLALAHVYAAPADPAEDPRPAIARIRSQAEPGDALVYVYIWQSGYLSAYYPQNDLALYRAYYTPETVGAEMEAIFADHARLWLLSYRVAAQDPQNLSGSWLEAHAYRAESAWYGDHHLALYLAPDFETPGVGPEQDTASFAGGIELRYPRVEARLAPGDALALPLRWRALSTPEENYQVFVHLGRPGQPPVAQSDGPPRNGLSPTAAWAAGQEVLDRRVLTLPETLAPGRYRLSAGLYRLSDGARLPVDGEDAVRLGTVEVRP